jgi:phosphatidylglycerophosphate synthase
MVSPAKSLRLRRPWSPGLGASVAISFALLAALLALAEPAIGLSPAYTARVLLAHAAVLAAVGILARRHLRPATFGAANLVTLLRAALTAALLGLLWEPKLDRFAWFAVVLAVFALLLDGVDGRLARRNDEATSFGARFDMETDAASILVLAVLCWAFGKAGLWVLAAGLLRYAFVAAARIARFMRAPLPSSRRRQTVCVVQIIALLLTLAPLTAVPLSSATAALGLAFLGGSFLVDVGWLWRRR